MTKLELKKINSVKSILSSKNKYSEHKTLFKNKQIRFLFSKMSIIFESNISSQDLAQIELSILENPTQKNFIDSIKKLSKTFDNKFINLKWKEFGICLWYVFQSTLFFNKKSKIPCEYTRENFISLNNIKRTNFSIWLKSLYDTENVDFNSYVLRVLEIIV
ncbi:MAG: hypothetical protein ACRC1F_00330 [Metamycoplasmataceae bacterium]